MTLKERLVADLTAAMKSRDAQRTGVLRMLKSKMLEAEVDQRAKKGTDYQIEDPDALAVVAAYAKQRRDAIEAYRQGGREDLAAKEEAELAIVQEYLPKQLSPDEIRSIVREAIAATGASSVKEMGVVMKAVMPKTKGAADGKLVNDIVRELLS